jgi:23S rRNA (guanosine2251-2'-O)-methyltransferase
MTKSKQQYIYGIHSIIEAIRAGQSLQKVLVKKGFKNVLKAELFDYLKKYIIPVQYVPVQKLNNITRSNHQGIIALASDIEYRNTEMLIPAIYERGKDPFMIVLDGITDIRNLGAIARSAEGAGVDALVLPNKGTAQVNADAIKTSSGALYALSVCRTSDLANTIHFLKNSGLQIVAVTEKARKLYYNIDFTLPTALIIGAEDHGIEKNILKITDQSVKIPMLGLISSLNVSVAASVIMYEVVRQREVQKT